MNATESTYDKFFDFLGKSTVVLFLIAVMLFSIAVPVVIIRNEVFPPECKFRIGDTVRVVSGIHRGDQGEIKDGALCKGVFSEWKYKIDAERLYIEVEERHLELVKPPFVYSLEEYL